MTRSEVDSRCTKCVNHSHLTRAILANDKPYWHFWFPHPSIQDEVYVAIDYTSDTMLLGTKGGEITLPAIPLSEVATYFSHEHLKTLVAFS